MTLEERHALTDEGIAQMLAAVEAMQELGTYTEAASLGVAAIMAALHQEKRISVIEDKLGIPFPPVPGVEETS